MPAAPLANPVTHTRHQEENFPVASWILPRRLHAPVLAIYRFARSADDIADEGELSPDARLAALDGYRLQLERIAQGQLTTAPQPADDLLWQNLALAIRQHRLPMAPFHDLLRAFSQDVIKTRYQTQAELLDYCRYSANPVGRLMLCLFDADSEQHRIWSDAICSALQLINHWQDVALDMAKTQPRLYLPQQELARYGVTEAQIQTGQLDANWQALMRSQLAQACELMHQGAPLGRALPGRLGLELRMICAGGLRIAQKIAAADYDVFRRRPSLGTLDAAHLLWQALTQRAGLADPLAACKPLERRP